MNPSKKRFEEVIEKSPYSGFYQYNIGACREQFQKHGINTGKYGCRTQTTKEVVQYLEEAIELNPAVFRDRIVIKKDFGEIMEGGALVFKQSGQLKYLVFFHSELCGIYFPQTYILLGYLKLMINKGLSAHHKTLSQLFHESYETNRTAIEFIANNTLPVNPFYSFSFFLKPNAFPRKVNVKEWVNDQLGSSKGQHNYSSGASTNGDHYPSPNTILHLNISPKED